MLRVLFTDGGVIDGTEEDRFSGLRATIRTRKGASYSTRQHLRTAYAMRSPLGSEERGVGCPRAVVGDAAHMASVLISFCNSSGSANAIPEISDIFGGNYCRETKKDRGYTTFSGALLELLCFTSCAQGKSATQRG